MTTETILTDEIISELSTKHLWAHPQFIGAGEVTIEGDDHFARAIEQAVLAKLAEQEPVAWLNDDKRGRVHLTIYAAITHAKALLDYKKG